MRLILISTFVVFCCFLVGGFPSDFLAQDDSKFNVKIINDSDLRKILDKEKENALLINVWATWCVPCREEFPSLVKLYENYQNKVKFIGISADDVDDLDSKVIPFLKSQNALFDNYLIKVKEPEDFINILDKNWSGAIPATFIYDKNGKQVVNLIGEQSYDDFETALKKVID